jgi:hypothetical protein
MEQHNFHSYQVPTHDDLVTLVHTISQRIARYLEKIGLVVRDMQSSYFNLSVDFEDSLRQLQDLRQI